MTATVAVTELRPASAEEIQPDVYHHIDDVPEYVCADGRHYRLCRIPKNFRGLHAPVYLPCDPPPFSIRRMILGWLGYH